MRFEWDDAKNALNIEKHALDFADAKDIFQSPMLTALDTRYDYGEERWIGIGFLKGRIVTVVFTKPGRDTIRVISLRKAVKRERTRLERALKDRLG